MDVIVNHRCESVAVTSSENDDRLVISETLPPLLCDCLFGLVGAMDRDDLLTAKLLQRLDQVN